jgi:hypothetical protein
MGLADPVPLRLPVAGLAGKGAGGVESGGGNVKPAVPSEAYSPDEGSPAGGLCRVLYQAGPEAGQGSYVGAEQVEGGGRGVDTPARENARYIKPRQNFMFENLSASSVANVDPTPHCGLPH